VIQASACAYYAHSSCTFVHTTQARVLYTCFAMSYWSCTFSGCSTLVMLDANTNSLRDHLFSHGYTIVSGKVECSCTGCLCPKQGLDGTRCQDRAPNHSWHGTDIVKHVINSHMNFRDVCHQCGDAGFANTFSLNRHISRCAGRTPARCRWCLTEFSSAAALGGHVELGLCMGTLIASNF
jgi:hypothetical protein